MFYTTMVISRTVTVSSVSLNLPDSVAARPPWEAELNRTVRSTVSILMVWV